MLNRNKKAAIIEWLNCLYGDYPIEVIPELHSGYHFYNIAKMINPPNDDAVEPQTIDERYAFVEQCINSFFNTTCAVLIKFESCKKGVEGELAKVCILLLSCLVHSYLTEKSEKVNALTELPSHIQEDIQACITAVLFSGDCDKPELLTDFANVLSQQTNYMYGSPPKRSSVSPSFQTPKAEKRGRFRSRVGLVKPSTSVSSAPSPLKTLLESPQVLSQVALREQEKKLRNIQNRLLQEENKSSDLETDKAELLSVIDKRDKEISQLKEKVREFRKYKEFAENFTAEQREGAEQEQELSKVINQRCLNCSALENSYRELEENYATVEEKLTKKSSQYDVLLSKQEAIASENSDLRKKIFESETASEIAQQKLADMEAIVDSYRESEPVYKAKYEELMAKCNQMAQAQEAHDESGESMDNIVPERKSIVLQRKVDNLEKQLEKSQSEVAHRGNVARQLETENKKLKSEIQRLEFQLSNKSSLLDKAQQSYTSAIKEMELITAKNEKQNKRHKMWEERIKMLDSNFSNRQRRDSQEFRQAISNYEKNLSELQQKYNLLLSEKQATEEEVKKLTESNRTFSADIEKERSICQAVQGQMEVNLQKLADSVDATEKLKLDYEKLRQQQEAEKQSLLEKISTLEKEIKAKEEVICSREGSLNEKILSLTLELKLAKERLKDKEHSLKELVQEKKRLQKKEEEMMQKQHDLKMELSKAQENAISQIKHLQEDLNVSDRKVHDYLLIIKDKEEEIANIDKNRKALECELKTYTGKHTAAVAQNSSLIQKIEELMQQEKIMKKEKEQNVAEIIQLKREIDHCVVEKAMCVSHSETLKKEYEEKYLMQERENSFLRLSLQKAQEVVERLTSAKEHHNMHEMLLHKEGENAMMEYCGHKEAGMEARNEEKVQLLQAKIQHHASEDMEHQQQSSDFVNQCDKTQVSQPEGNQGSLTKHIASFRLARLTIENDTLNNTITMLKSEKDKLQLQLSVVEKQAQEAKSDGINRENSMKEQLVNLQNKVDDLQKKLSESEAERENLSERLEDLDRRLRAALDSKELAEKEYFMCIQAKDKTIEEFERQNTALCEALDVIEKSIAEDTEANSQQDSLSESWRNFGSIRKIADIWGENRKMYEAIQSLHEKNIKLEQENKRYHSMAQRMKNEMKAISEGLPNYKHKLADCSQCALLEKDITELEKDKKSLQRQYKAMMLEQENRKQARVFKAPATNLWDDLQKTKQSNWDLREELQKTKDSLPSLQSQIRELQSKNSEMMNENKELSAQLEEANCQIKKLSKQSEVDSFCPPKRRFTVSNASKQDLGSVRKLKGLHRQYSGKKQNRHCIVRKNTTKNVTETIVYQKASSTSADNPNVSVVSEGFNKSSVGGNHFQCDDEEEFWDHRSLSKLDQPSTSVAPTPSRRLSEFQKRNSLCPPHMRSSYPVETQMVPSQKYPDEVSILAGDLNKPKSEPPEPTPKRRLKFNDFSAYGEEAESEKFSTPSHSDGKGKKRNLSPADEMLRSIRTPTSFKKFLVARKKFLEAKKDELSVDEYMSEVFRGKRRSIFFPWKQRPPSVFLDSKAEKQN